jgi:hypothetical protein
MRASLGGVAAGVLALGVGLLPGIGRAEAINGSGRTLMADCGGGDATLNGSDNRVVFQGPCRALRIAGANNQVEIELMPGAPIEIMGAANHVLYAPMAPSPVVSAQGAGNVVEAGSAGAASAALAPALPDRPPAPPALVIAPAGPPAGAVVLDGDDEDSDVACTGRDVLIHGSHSRYVLRGGCRSITVQGRANRIQAELQPGARIAVGGDAVTLDYTLTRPGPAPVVSVTGSGSQATHIQHFDGPTVMVPSR